MNKHKSNKIKENSNTVRHLIMGQITTTQNLVAIKEVRHAGQWRHQMETFFALLALVRGIHRSSVDSPQRPGTRSFDVVYDLRLNERLNKQLRLRWFETSSHPLWRHFNDAIVCHIGSSYFCVVSVTWCFQWCIQTYPLRWHHNGCDGVSNHQLNDCLLNRLFRRSSRKTSKLRVTGLCAGNSPGTGELPTQMASKAENVSIWWRHHQIVSVY